MYLRFSYSAFFLISTLSLLLLDDRDKTFDQVTPVTQIDCKIIGALFQWGALKCTIPIVLIAVFAVNQAAGTVINRHRIIWVKVNILHLPGIILAIPIRGKDVCSSNG